MLLYALILISTVERGHGVVVIYKNCMLTSIGSILLYREIHFVLFIESVHKGMH